MKNTLKYSKSAVSSKFAFSIIGYFSFTVKYFRLISGFWFPIFFDNLRKIVEKCLMIVIELF